LNFTNVKLLNLERVSPAVMSMNLAKALAHVAPIAIVLLVLAIA